MSLIAIKHAIERRERARQRLESAQLELAAEIRNSRTVSSTSWESIAKLLGTSKQAVQHRYGRTKKQTP